MLSRAGPSACEIGTSRHDPLCRQRHCSTRRFELYTRLWQNRSGDPFIGRRQRPLLGAAGFEPLETRGGARNLWGLVATVLADSLDGPRLAERAMQLGWVDSVTLRRLTDALRAWAAEPDGIWIHVVLETVGSAKPHLDGTEIPT